MNIDLENLPKDISELHQVVCSLISEQANITAMNSSLIMEKEIWHSEKHQLFSEKEVLVSEKESLFTENKGIADKYNILAEKYEQLIFRLKGLLRDKYGSKSESLKNIEDHLKELEERVEDNETNASYHDKNTEELDVPGDSKESKKEKKVSRKGRSRQVLDPKLKREIIDIAAPSICPECECESFTKISEDVSEFIEYVPGSYVVKQTIRPRLSCKKCKHIVQGELPSLPISKGKAGPGFLANMLMNKYLYHLPIYRQSKMLLNEGIEISRSTMNGWVGQLSLLLEPLCNHLRKNILSSRHIHGDDTTVKVLSPGFGKTKTGRLWIYARDGRGHGSLDPPGIGYYYSPDRKGIRPEEHLKDFEGVLHADAYSGYNKLFIAKEGEEVKITESNCWAHVRRKFYDIVVSSNNAKTSHWVLEKIGEIYAQEREVRGEPPKTRKNHRQEKSIILVDEFFNYIKLRKKELPSKSNSVKAINYALNQEAGLRAFLNDGKIEIDNNIAERGMRCIAVGRKNWLFAGSDSGGERAANMYSLLQTAELNGINPLEYMTDVLKRLPDHSIQKLDELLPWNFGVEE